MIVPESLKGKIPSIYKLVPRQTAPPPHLDPNVDKVCRLGPPDQVQDCIKRLSAAAAKGSMN